MNVLIFVLVPLALAGGTLWWMAKGSTNMGAPQSPTPPGPPLSGGSSRVPSTVLDWLELAKKYAASNPRVSPAEILAIIWNESSGNPLASNPGDPSWGLMGVTSLIAKAYGGFLSGDLSWQTDGEKNISAGAAYLADLKAKYGGANPMTWVQAYNLGESKFRRGLRAPGYSSAFFSHLSDLAGVA